MVSYITPLIQGNGSKFDVDPEIKDKLGDHWALQYDEGAWRAFEGMSRMFFSVASIFSQVFMVFALLRKNLADPTFLAACILVPLLNYIVDSSAVYSLWNKGKHQYFPLKLQNSWRQDSVCQLLHRACVHADDCSVLSGLQ